MPIYEFRCESCQHIFEEWCRRVEEGDTPRECPKCARTANRILSQTSFALKGDGWYVTEYTSRKNDAKQDCDPAHDSAVPAEGATPASTATAQEGQAPAEGGTGATATAQGGQAPAKGDTGAAPAATATAQGAQAPAKRATGAAFTERGASSPSAKAPTAAATPPSASPSATAHTQ